MTEKRRREEQRRPVQALLQRGVLRSNMRILSHLERVWGFFNEIVNVFEPARKAGVVC
jgi:hypothetical protein